MWNSSDLGNSISKSNCIQEEIKNRFKSGNSFSHSVKNLVSSSLLSKNIKIRIHITKIFPVILSECETWSLTLREKHRLRVFKNRVLRKVLGPKKYEVTSGEDYIMKSFMICTPHHIIWVTKSRRITWAGHVEHMRERRGA